MAPEATEPEQKRKSRESQQMPDSDKERRGANGKPVSGPADGSSTLVSAESESSKKSTEVTTTAKSFQAQASATPLSWTKVKLDSGQHCSAPGFHLDTTTFMNVFEQEAVLTAYCGYDDIAQLRKYLLSHHFLVHFQKYNAAWSRDVDRNIVLDHIQQAWIDGWDREAFPLDDEKCLKYARKTYSEIQRSLKEIRLAHILIMFVENVEQSSEKYNSVDAMQQSVALRKLGMSRKDCPWIHTCQLSGMVQLPSFGTNVYTETALER